MILRAACLAVAAFRGLTAARAADSVTIGASYPLVREPDAKAAIATAAEIVNTPQQGLDRLPLGAGQGLPRIAGAKIAVDFADDLASPSVAEAQALRLIARDHVAALIGDGGSSETLAAAAVAERHGVPFLVPDARAPSITGRGLQWVFRTGPLPADIARAYARFLGELKQSNTKLDAVALVFEDSDAGRAEAEALRDRLSATGFTVAGITYNPNAENFSATVTALRQQNPDVAIFISRAADAILLMKTMPAPGYKAPIEIGDGAGFADPGFVAAVGNLAQGMIGRAAWSAGEPDSPAAIVNRLYRAKTGRDLDDPSAETVQGVLILADAIDRAGSADPTVIRDALRRTDLKPEQLIVGYEGVRFDASGQNALASTWLTQLQGKLYVRVWPMGQPSGKPVLPYKGWE